MRALVGSTKSMRCLALTFAVACAACTSTNPAHVAPTAPQVTADLQRQAELDRFVTSIFPLDVITRLVASQAANLNDPAVSPALKRCILDAAPVAIQGALLQIASDQFHDLADLRRVNDLLGSELWQTTIRKAIENRGQLTQADREAVSKFNLNTFEDLKAFASTLEKMKKESTLRATRYVLEKCVNESREYKIPG
jgi:hypothetical protein